MQKFWGGNVEKFVEYAEKIMNYAEISTVNKIDNKAFGTKQQWNKKHFKVLPTI